MKSDCRNTSKIKEKQTNKQILKLQIKYRHDIAEIFIKVALNTKIQSNQIKIFVTLRLCCTFIYQIIICYHNKVDISNNNVNTMKNQTLISLIIT